MKPNLILVKKQSQLGRELQDHLGKHDQELNFVCYSEEEKLLVEE